MSPIALIPDWSVVLTEFTSNVSFLSLSPFFLICFLIILSVYLGFFSPSLSLCFFLSSLFSFPKIYLVVRRFFFPPFSLLVQYRPQSGQTHTYSLTLFPCLKKIIICRAQKFNLVNAFQCYLRPKRSFIQIRLLRQQYRLKPQLLLKSKYIK
jgi:hypothetical protein